jgi:hypothetical protein
MKYFKELREEYRENIKIEILNVIENNQPCWLRKIAKIFKMYPSQVKIFIDELEKEERITKMVVGKTILLKVKK